MKDLNSLGLRHKKGMLEILDQTLLPHEEVWHRIENPDDMIRQIKRLAVRGAPLIGVGAAVALAHYAERGVNRDGILLALQRLRESRPTAVNLMNCLDRMKSEFEKSNFENLILIREAEKIFDEDVSLCESMAIRGAEFIEDGDGILTHCNTGGLATVGIGTALGVIRKAYEQGKKIHVYVDETRPLLQGARLTTWELNKLNIPFTLICDNMAASLMAAGKVKKIFVGADRIALNGDVANKIGTYNVAIAANYHKIPFYVVAPKTTLDMNCKTGRQIPIEQRASNEVLGERGLTSAPVWNPAFDVTPRALITHIILDDRLF